MVLKRTLPGGIDLSVRTLIGVGLIAAVVFEAAAQRRGSPLIGGPANPVVPGVAQPISPPGSAPHGFGHGSLSQPLRHHPSSTGAIVPVPYVVAVPVYVGGSDNQGVLPPQEDPPGSAAPLPDQPFPIPYAGPPGPLPAIINGRLHNAEPAVAERACPQPQPEDPVQFFIALKDGWVTTAAAYWISERTLHYITPQGSHNMVSLELIDRPRSARLNEGGRTPFLLPP